MKEQNNGSEFTIGLDLGERRHRFCALNGKGELVEEATVGNERASLARLTARYHGALAVMEAGAHRDARFEPTAWFGAFLVIVGTTGIWPSVLAIVDHKPFVFAGIIWPRALSPWLATLGYGLSTILGSALLIRAGAVGKYTKEHQ